MVAMSVAQPLVQSSLLGEAIAQAQVIVLVADEEMRYLAANDYACEMLGYEREALLGLRVSDVTRDDDSAHLAGNAGEGDTGKARLARKDGTEFTVEYVSAETRIAGMTVSVAIAWPEKEPAPTPPSQRRRDPALASA